MSIRTRAPFVALLCLFTAQLAQAQTYRCNVGGTLYLQDKPCTSPTDKPANMGALGATRTSTAYQPPPPPALQPAPEHQRFMSGRCASLNDAIRTAPSRGVGYSTVYDLRREFARDCAEDEQYARTQLSESSAKARQEVRAQRQEAERSREDAQRLQERCAALRETVRSRRAQAGTDPALTRVAEDAYNASCLGR